jgi:hypothetical protein
MSVRVISPDAAVEAVKNFKRTSAQVRKNFFEVFDTSGCLLNCECERLHARSRKNTKRKEWFTASEIAASVLKGCRSCYVLNLIIQESFLRSEHSVSSTDQYSISRNFELKRLPAGEKTVEMIQLFQPSGM